MVKHEFHNVPGKKLANHEADMMNFKKEERKRYINKILGKEESNSKGEMLNDYDRKGTTSAETIG